MALGKQFEDAVSLVDETRTIPVFGICRCVFGQNEYGQRLVILADGTNYAYARSGKGDPFDLDLAREVGV
jgi:hypothetical protein